MPGIVTAIIVVIHIVVCVGLMVSILLQSGKGGGLAGAFGAGSSQTLFGGRGAATFLSRATTVLAVVFFVTSLTLGLQASRKGGARQSLIQEEARKKTQQRTPTEGTAVPAAPAGGALAPGSEGTAPSPQGLHTGAPNAPATPGASQAQPPASSTTK